MTHPSSISAPSSGPVKDDMSSCRVGGVQVKEDARSDCPERSNLRRGRVSGYLYRKEGEMGQGAAGIDEALWYNGPDELAHQRNIVLIVSGAVTSGEAE
jgi:hypothetical protein